MSIPIFFKYPNHLDHLYFITLILSIYLLIYLYWIYHYFVANNKAKGLGVEEIPGREMFLCRLCKIIVKLIQLEVIQNLRTTI